jgi:mannose/fructose/N-acetylgalactosamine-specific phosphotransferase system component IIC
MNSPEEVLMAQPLSPRRWPYAILLLVSLASLLFGYSGFAMAASFTVSNPESVDHWRHMALAYLGLCGLSLIGIAIAIVALRRRSRERATQVTPAG